MRVLHASFTKKPITGIIHQLLQEQEAASARGLPWDVRIYCPRDSRLPLSIAQYDKDLSASDSSGYLDVRQWLKLRSGFYRWLRSVQAEYDALLIRYSSYDPFQLVFLIRAKIPIFLVHHTLEVSDASTYRLDQ